MREGRRDALDAIGIGFALQGTVLVSGVLAARLLGPEQRGLLALLWVVALALSQLGVLGVPAAAAVLIGRDRGDRRALIAACVRHGAAQTVVIAVLQVLVLVAVFDGPVLAAALTLLAPPAMIAQVYALAVLQGLGHVRAMQLLRVLATAAYAAALVVAVVTGGESLTLVAFAWAGSYVLAAALTCVVAARRVRVLAPDTAVTAPGAELRGFGRRAMFGSISPLETFRVDQLLVGLVLSPAQLGLYVAALAFTNLPRFIAQGFGQAAVARIAPLTGVLHIRHALLHYTVLGTVVAIAVSAPLALLAGPLVELFFGSQFAGASGLVHVLLLATVLVCTRRVLTDGLRGAGRAAAGSVAEVSSYVAVVPALAVGVVVGGAEGVAWALAAASLVSLLVLVALGRDLLFVHSRHQDRKGLMRVSKRPPVRGPECPAAE